MARQNRKSRSGNKNRVTNVRITDPSAGSDGLKIDRMISALQTSESQIRILVGDNNDFSTATSSQVGTYDFGNVFSSDDFQSMIQQFELFRVVAFKFNISDVASGVAVANVWSTFHDDYTTVPTFTRPNVADGPDSRVISAGTGETTLYWMAHGTTEEGFQSDGVAGSTPSKYGGLRFFIGADSAGPRLKYSLAVHAVVDFRGRI